MNEIICGDCREVLKSFPRRSIDLIVTSPPYNVGKEYHSYEDSKGFEEYLDFLIESFNMCHEVLKDGAYLCLNIADTGRQPFLPLHSYVTMLLIELGYFMRGVVIWNKIIGQGGKSTAWGSWLKPTDPCLRDVHEYVLVFKRKGEKMDKGDSDITSLQFLKYTESIWTFPPETTVNHPAPFPVELPKRCIKLYTYPGEVVLDPFVGSGTTCVVAKMLGRNYIGIDIDPSYCHLAEERLKNTPKNLRDAFT